MDLRQLRSLVQIVELGSITGAADRLNIAQPSLSRQVKALEEELGVPLLCRHGRGVMPTEEGERLARRARVILEDVQNLASDISAGSGPLSGTVTLGLPPTVSEVLATHLVERTMAEYPEVKLRITSGFSGHVQDWLLRGKIDIGIAYDGRKAPAIRSQPIIVERLFLIQSANVRDARDGAPIHARDALRQPLILPNPEHGLRDRIEAIAHEHHAALDVVLEIDILSTMLAFVERGLGATILPLVSVSNQIREGRLIARPIVQRTIDRTLVLMTLQNRPGSRLNSSFAAFLTAEVQEMASTGKWPGTRV